MKFRDPKTEEVFEDLEAARLEHCNLLRGQCRACELQTIHYQYGCIDFFKDYPELAACLMGYEVVEEQLPDATKLKEATMEKVEESEKIGQKPYTRFDQIKSCETPEEMYELLDNDDHSFCPMEYEKSGLQCDCTCLECISNWLKEPVTPNFTQDEVAAMRVLSAGGVTHLVREEDGRLRACEGSPERKMITANGVSIGFTWKAKGHWMADKCFPSLCPGQSVRLEDINDN